MVGGLNKWDLYHISDGRKGGICGSERFRVHSERPLPIAKGRCWRAYDGVEMMSILSLLESVQIFSEQQLLKHPRIEFAPLFSPRYVAHRRRPQHTRPDAIIEMFPPVTAPSARIGLV
jgi:hypothetical protein